MATNSKASSSELVRSEASFVHIFMVTVAAMTTLSNKSIATLMYETGLRLEDWLSFILAGVSPRWTDLAEFVAIPILADCDLQINTSYTDGHEYGTDYEHSRPILARTPPDQRDVSSRLLIFEVDYRSRARYAYHPKQHKPVEVILRTPDGRSFEMVLKPYRTSPKYESGSFDFPEWNTSLIGPRERFTVFQHFHEEDVHRRYPIKIYYRTVPNDEDHLKLHVVLVPLELLVIVLSGDSRRF